MLHHTRGNNVWVLIYTENSPSAILVYSYNNDTCSTYVVHTMFIGKKIKG